LSCLGFTTFGGEAAGRAAGRTGTRVDGVGVGGADFEGIAGDGTAGTVSEAGLVDAVEIEGVLPFNGGKGARDPLPATDFIGGRGFFSPSGLFSVGPPGMFRF